VVVCAYNAEATLDECLRHACRLDYPNLEIVVVDDGSADATAAIVGSHPRARLVTQPHAGLSAARNTGFRAAAGELVAYLDADAYPSPEWPYLLALGLDGPAVAGVGGPNVPPTSDGTGAQCVARAPGGPVHVLVGDDRAEHVPGCNMAFRRAALAEVGGYDPIFTTAGDDVDLCWRVLDKGWEIGFHPAALVWHHRRPTARAYLRQQRGYGRAEALVARRHPDRFTAIGTARWRGRIYTSLAAPAGRQRIYRGPFGTASYQSLYRGGGSTLDLAHQAGVPLAAGALLTAPLLVLSRWALVAPLTAATFLLVLTTIDAVRTVPPGMARTRWQRLGCRLSVAALSVLQPLCRWWGRTESSPVARRMGARAAIAGPARRASGRVIVLPAVGARAETSAAVVSAVRASGATILASTGWDGYDALVLGSLFVAGEIVTSGVPDGVVQVRIRRRPRLRMLVGTLGALGVLGVIFPTLAAVLATCAVAEGARGLWRAGPKARAAILAAARLGETAA
jgi:glycosyltransferase involved in cell wall biosynthesis